MKSQQINNNDDREENTEGKNSRVIFSLVEEQRCFICVTRTETDSEITSSTMLKFGAANLQKLAILQDGIHICPFFVFERGFDQIFRL